MNALLNHVINSVRAKLQRVPDVDGLNEAQYRELAGEEFDKVLSQAIHANIRRNMGRVRKDRSRQRNRMERRSRRINFAIARS